MTQDLTKITTPFGLLDKETQDALLAHGGPLQIYTMNGWRDWQVFMIDGVEMAFPKSSVVRVKPQPPKPREWWAAFVGNLHYGMWETEALAHQSMRDCSGVYVYTLIHVREVLE